MNRTMTYKISLKVQQSGNCICIVFDPWFVDLQTRNLQTESIDKGTLDREPVDQEFVDRETLDRGSVHRGTLDREAAHRQSVNRGPIERGNAESGPTEREPIDSEPIERDLGGQWQNTPLITSLWRQRQVALCERSSLVYRARSTIVRLHIEKPCLEK